MLNVILNKYSSCLLVLVAHLKPQVEPVTVKI